jgi:hypothetical protein
MSDAGGFFELFQRSAWRLETRPFYGPDAEAFERHQSGQLPTSEQRARRQRWLDGITAATRSGRVMGRILVVTLPLSPYLRWRIETAGDFTAAGEQIRVADRGVHAELAGLISDHWTFDDERVLRMDYGPDGAFLGSQQVTDPASIDRYRRERDLAVACSVPLEEFMQATR